MNTQLIFTLIASTTFSKYLERHHGDLVGVKDNEVCAPILIAIGLCNNNIAANVLGNNNSQASSTGKGDATA